MARKKLSAEEIVEQVSELETWITEDDFLKKRFNFTNFAEALDFVNRVGAIAEKLDHHPDITFGWGYAEFAITTHDAGGLTHNDFDLAKEIKSLDENKKD
jgi:4a-hydroxytetrahydrobiopterin dehydratase